MRRAGKFRSALVGVGVAAVFAALGAGQAVAAPGIASFSTEVSTSSAGAHPDLRTTFVLNSGPSGPEGTAIEAGIELPPGLIGNPNAVPRCSQQAIAAGAAKANKDGAVFVAGGDGILEECGANTVVGAGTLEAGFASMAVYNVQLVNAEPRGDDVGRFVLVGKSVPPIYLAVRARTSSDFGLNSLSPEIDSGYNLLSLDLTIWAVPGAHTRGMPLCIGGLNCSAATPEIPADPANTWKPFLANPTVCDGPKTSRFSVRFKGETVAHEITATEPGLTNCQNVPFKPSISVTPSSAKADDAAGLDVQLGVPQSEEADGIASSHLRDSVVVLPEGMSLNPSAADGLQGCTEAEIGLLGTNFPYPNPMRFSKDDATCPGAAKVGTVETDVPALPGPLKGSVYLATPYKNPFGSMTAIYLWMKGYGLNVKLAGNVQLDPVTGKVTTTFKDNPQVPFRTLNFRLKGGSRAAIATPETCGTFTTTSTLTPWSGNAAATPSATFAQTQSAGGGACGASDAARPFATTLQGGTASATAGAFSPFSAKVVRAPGQQELKRFQMTLPEGLLGRLAGIPYCSEAAITAAHAQTSGAAEQANPSCPAATQVGTVQTGAGAGDSPLYVGGKAYLAGPYKGAPLSVVVVTPAVAGPFDLGNVVVRAALNVNPATAQITAVSDELPEILAGVPLRIRSVAINIDRPDFTMNPTSCDPMSLLGQMTGSNGLISNPTSPFQVSNCSALGFSPRLQLSLKGGTKRGKFPALTAVLTQPPGQANIDRVAVTLPHSEFLEQAHIRTVCTRAQYAADACPAGSVYGYAIAESPLLDRPLEGPVYLRSNPEHELPDLVAALRGQINIDLAGRIDSVNGGIRNTFDIVPDAPVSKFTLKMQGGKKGLLVNSKDICGSTNRATVLIDGQNGKTADQWPKLTNGSCKKAKKAAKKQRRRR